MELNLEIKAGPLGVYCFGGDFRFVFILKRVQLPSTMTPGAAMRAGDGVFAFFRTNKRNKDWRGVYRSFSLDEDEKIGWFQGANPLVNSSFLSVRNGSTDVSKLCGLKLGDDIRLQIRSGTKISVNPDGLEKPDEGLFKLKSTATVGCYIEHKDVTGSDDALYAIRSLSIVAASSQDAQFHFPGMVQFDYAYDTTQNKGLKAGISFLQVNDPKSRRDRSQLNVVHHPLLSLSKEYGGSSVEMKYLYDPFDDIVDEENDLRTTLLFSAGSKEITEGYGAAFKTTEGRRVFLHPVVSVKHTKREGRFRLTKQPTSVSWTKVGKDLVLAPGTARNHLFAPEGEFELGIKGYEEFVPEEEEKEFHSLVCSRRSDENLKFRYKSAKGPGDIIEFVRGMPALVQPQSTKFSDGSKDLDGISNWILGTGTTSWVRIRPNNPASEHGYYSQPEDAPLYSTKDGKLRSTNITAGPVILDHVELPAGSGDRAIPLLPFGDFDEESRVVEIVGESLVYNVEERVSELKSVEEGFDLDADRLTYVRKILSNGNVPLNLRALDNSLDATTPQGFLLNVEKTGRFNRLDMAMTQGRSKDGAPAERPLSFDFKNQGKSYLQDGFEKSQVFMVLSDLDLKAANLDDFVDAAKLADWGFFLRPENRSSDPAKDFDGAVYIVKFHDESIEELVKDPGKKWESPDLSNKELQNEVSDYLLQYIKDVKRKADPQADKSQAKLYRKLDSILKDPTWNGILAIRSRINLEDIPAQIQGLIPGINLKRFFAEYIAIELTPLNSQQFKMRESAAYALIDYDGGTKDENWAEGKKNQGSEYPEPYSMKVDYLRVLFEKSEIVDFQCRVMLKVPSLFYDDVKLNKPLVRFESDENIVVFDGRYERRIDGNNNVVDTYTFSSNEAWSYKFDNPFVEEVVQTKLQFMTNVVKPLGAKVSKVEARISFWGSMTFGDIADFDLLNIDGVDYADMGLVIGFNLDTNDIKNPKVDDFDLSFDVGNLAFDFEINSDVFRSPGLLSKFPIKFSGFNFSPSFKNLLGLGDLGFFNIGAASGGDEKQSDKFQYGLRFDVDLGFLGDLLGALKDMKFEFLVGWRSERKEDKPGKENSFSFGIRFPKSAGGRLELGVQGVLKLVIAELELKEEDFNGSDYFVLKLIGMYLEVLGNKFPDEDGVDMLVIAGSDLKDENLLKNIAWLLAWDADSEPENTGVIDLQSLVVGQRFNPDRSGNAKTTKEVVKAAKKIPDKSTAEILRQNYDADGGWLVTADFEVMSVLRLMVAFFDPELYGLRLEPNIDSLPSIDILYRRIDDELGVYSIELGVPPEFRTFEVGAASFTLPDILIAIYTNGDFLVDIGFPENLDFSRSFRVEVLPFTGSGGMYFAKLSSKTSDMFPSKEDGLPDSGMPETWRVVEFEKVLQGGIAVDVGIGKNIDTAIFKAGVSVTVFTILEGALGYSERDDSSTTDGLFDIDGIAMRGRYGIQGKIQGYVDFRLIKGYFLVRVWVSVGGEIKQIKVAPNNNTKDLQTYIPPILLHFEAGVEVHIRFLIAKIWKCEIYIDLRFSKQIRYEWQLRVDTPPWEKQALRSAEYARSFRQVSDELKPIAWRRPYKYYHITPTSGNEEGKEELEFYFFPNFTHTLEASVPKKEDASVRKKEAKSKEQIVLQLVHMMGLRRPSQDAEGAPISQKSIRDEDQLVTLLKPMAAWAVFTISNGRIRPTDQNNEKIEWSFVKEISERLAVSTADNSFNLAKLKELLELNFNLVFSKAPDKVQSFGDDEENRIRTSIFPFIPDAKISTTVEYEDSTQTEITDLSQFVVPDSYRDRLRKYFEKMLVVSDERNQNLREGNVPVAELLFVDYFDALLREIFALMRAVFEGKRVAPRGAVPDNILWTDLWKELTQLPSDKEEESSRRSYGEDLSQIGERISRMYMQGLRLPPETDGGVTEALYKKWGLQVELLKEDKVEKVKKVTTQLQLGGSKFKNLKGGNIRRGPVYEVSGVEVKVHIDSINSWMKTPIVRGAPAFVSLDPVQKLSALERQNKQYGLFDRRKSSKSVSWRKGQAQLDTERNVYSLPDGLIADVRAWNTNRDFAIRRLERSKDGEVTVWTYLPHGFDAARSPAKATTILVAGTGLPPTGFDGEAGVIRSTRDAVTFLQPGPFQILESDDLKQARLKGAAGLPVKLRSQKQDPYASPQPEPQDIPLEKWSWGLRLNIGLKKAGGGDGQYLINGANESVRRHLDDLLIGDAKEFVDWEKVKISIELNDDDREAVLADADKGAAHIPFIIKTNLSTEANPQSLLAEGFRTSIDPLGVVTADMDGNPVEKENFLELIRQCSITNSGGYFLNIEGLAEGKDEEEDIVQISLVVDFAGADKNEAFPFYNAVITGEDWMKDDVFEFIELSTRYSYHVVTPPGVFGFYVLRKDPKRWMSFAEATGVAPVDGSGSWTREEFISATRAWNFADQNNKGSMAGRLSRFKSQ